MSFSQLSDPHQRTDPSIANQALCADLSLLFSTLVSGLADVIARTGGKPLGAQFTQQLGRYADQHGWTVLTGLTDLSELGQRIPNVDAKILLSVYRSYTRHANLLARQILGEQLLKSTVATMLSRLPAHLVAVNTQYGIIEL